MGPHGAASAPSAWGAAFHPLEVPLAGHPPRPGIWIPSGGDSRSRGRSSLMHPTRQRPDVTAGDGVKVVRDLYVSIWARDCSSVISLTAPNDP